MFETDNFKTMRNDDLRLKKIEETLNELHCSPAASKATASPTRYLKPRTAFVDDYIAMPTSSSSLLLHPPILPSLVPSPPSLPMVVSSSEVTPSTMSPPNLYIEIKSSTPLTSKKEGGCHAIPCANDEINTSTPGLVCSPEVSFPLYKLKSGCPRENTEEVYLNGETITITDDLHCDGILGKVIKTSQASGNDCPKFLDVGDIKSAPLDSRATTAPYKASLLK